jgi:hypothetical protein
MEKNKMSEEYQIFERAIKRTDNTILLNQLRDEIDGHFCLDTSEKNCLNRIIIGKIKGEKVSVLDKR